MSRKKTHEEFLEEVKALVGEEYEVIGKYVNTATKIEMVHNKCGHKYEVVPNSFLRGRRCPKCLGKMKKTTDIFKKEVYELVGNEYEVLGEYKNSNTKILFRHTECNHKYEATPSKFLNGRRCPKCFGNHKKTTEQYKKEVYDLVGDEYEVIGEYVDSGTKIAIKHNECGDIRDVVAGNFLSVKGSCPRCSNKLKKTTDNFKKEMLRLVGKSYIMLDDYVNCRTKIKIKHNKCGYEYEVTPSNFLNGKRCPKCAGKCKTTESFKQEVYNLVGDEYKILNKYTKGAEKMKFYHEKCQRIYEATPSSFLRGSRCPKCRREEQRMNQMYTIEEVRRKIFELVGDEYNIASTIYNGMKEKIIIQHNKCGHEYKVKLGNFFSGKRCPKCASSKGEKEISGILKDNHIKYAEQYRFDDCRNKYPLPFDFAVFDNDLLSCLIEFDGMQHYEPVKAWGGMEMLQQRQHNDHIKNQYCKDNNIKLIRIPYWDFDNIEDILNEELKDLIGSKICTWQTS